MTEPATSMPQRRTRRPVRTPGQAKVLLTPIVNMSTILLIFLLMSYSTGGSLMYMAQNILMPESISREQLEPSVEVAVAKDRIYVDGEVVMDDLAPWYENDKLLMPILYESLKQRSMKYRQMEKQVPLFRFLGKITIQADREIPYRLLKKVLYTADRADFPSITLAVYQRE